MNTRNEADPALAVYLDSLLLQLRLLDVPGDRIGQILAEVETHVADTGLGPVDAFGEAGEYAAAYVAAAAAPPALGGSRGWLPDLGVAMVAGMAGAALVEGLVHLAGSADITVRGLGGWLAVGVLGMAVFRVFGAQLSVDTASGSEPVRFASRTMLLGGLAYLGAAAVLVLIPLLLPTGPTLASAPGWVLFAGALLAFFALVRHLGGDRVVDPRG